MLNSSWFSFVRIFGIFSFVSVFRICSIFSFVSIFRIFSIFSSGTSPGQHWLHAGVIVAAPPAHRKSWAVFLSFLSIEQKIEITRQKRFDPLITASSHD